MNEWRVVEAISGPVGDLIGSLWLGWEEGRGGWVIPMLAGRCCCCPGTVGWSDLSRVPWTTFLCRGVNLPDLSSEGPTTWCLAAFGPSSFEAGCTLLRTGPL